MSRGVVIGKFYPPHRGHKFLIDTARKQVSELSVIVCDHKDQTISGQQRARWLEEIHPNVKIYVVPDIYPDDDSQTWAQYTVETLGAKPDIVFTSEDYGDAYASFMGAKHVLVDKERKSLPISASAIRKNPFKNWDYLEPCVRGYFALRISIVGAESTGKTTIAQALAGHYKTSWVPEFGRLYWEGKMKAVGGTDWRSEEFIYIANQQNTIEDAMAKTCNRLLFCDTDSIATGLWHERYMGYRSVEVNSIGRNRKYNFYFLTDIDSPFIQDGWRDGEQIRLPMHQRFLGCPQYGKPTT